MSSLLDSRISLADQLLKLGSTTESAITSSSKKGKRKPQYKSDEHERWHRIVEGQIRDHMYHHPEFYNVRQQTVYARSLAKRIVGEIVADGVKVVGNKNQPWYLAVIGSITKWCSNDGTSELR